MPGDLQVFSQWGHQMFRKPYALLAILLLVCSVLTIISARAYEYWSGNQPGPGFFPFWLGVLLAVFSFIMLLTAMKSAKGGSFELPNRAGLKKILVIAVAQLGFLLIIPKLGFLITSSIFLFALFVFFPKYSNLTNGILSIFISVVFYLIFQKWLLVQLPTGYFSF
jgi:putative tricarboxylic transport membrane protein